MFNEPVYNPNSKLYWVKAILYYVLVYPIKFVLTIFSRFRKLTGKKQLAIALTIIFVTILYLSISKYAQKYQEKWWVILLVFVIIGVSVYWVFNNYTTLNLVIAGTISILSIIIPLIINRDTGGTQKVYLPITDSVNYFLIFLCVFLGLSFFVGIFSFIPNFFRNFIEKMNEYPFDSLLKTECIKHAHSSNLKTL